MVSDSYLAAELDGTIAALYTYFTTYARASQSWVRIRPRYRGRIATVYRVFKERPNSAAYFCALKLAPTERTISHRKGCCQVGRNTVNPLQSCPLQRVHIQGAEGRADRRILEDALLARRLVDLVLSYHGEARVSSSGA